MKKMAYPWMKPTERLSPMFINNLSIFDFLLEKFGNDILPKQYEKVLLSTYMPEISYEKFVKMIPEEKKRIISSPNGLLSKALRDSEILDPPPNKEYPKIEVEEARRRVGRILGVVAFFADEISDSIKDRDKSKNIIALRDLMMGKAKELDFKKDNPNFVSYEQDSVYPEQVTVSWLTKKLKFANKKILIIMRGVSGSGKSTKAKKLGYGGVVLSTDEFFIKNGKYDFDPEKIEEAHSWNQKRAKEHMKLGTSPIVIDNTNLKAYEAKPYVKMGLDNGYEIKIEEPESPIWEKFKSISSERDENNVAEELSKINKHEVPKEIILEMMRRYDKDLTVEKVMDSVSPWEKDNAK